MRSFAAAPKPKPRYRLKRRSSCCCSAYCVVAKWCYGASWAGRRCPRRRLFRSGRRHSETLNVGELPQKTPPTFLQLDRHYRAFLFLLSVSEISPRRERVCFRVCLGSILSVHIWWTGRVLELWTIRVLRLWTGRVLKLWTLVLGSS